jgi:hypothetical protein
MVELYQSPLWVPAIVRIVRHNQYLVELCSSDQQVTLLIAESPSDLRPYLAHKMPVKPDEFEVIDFNVSQSFDMDSYLKN